MTTILVPLDDSDLSHQALPAAAWLARGLQADVVLLTVGPFPETGAQAADERKELRRQLDRAKRSLPGLTVHERVGTNNDPAQGILAAIADVHPDLVVMSTHGREGWAELVQDSVAEQVVRAGVVPVTLIHPRLER